MMHFDKHRVHLNDKEKLFQLFKVLKIIFLFTMSYLFFIILRQTFSVNRRSMLGITATFHASNEGSIPVEYFSAIDIIQEIFTI